MASIPQQVSESTRRRNPHLYGLTPLGKALSKMPSVKEVGSGKRIRQDTKPLMNKLEAEWFNQLQDQFPNYPRPRAQAKRYRLGNGIWFKPDVTASQWPRPNGPACETAWEVKGPHAFRGGFENLKVAAATYPEVRWVLVWKEHGQWKQQEVLP